jgi:transposase
MLVVEVHRVRCRRCGWTTERVPFLLGKHPYTKRLCKAVARDCEDAAARRVATKWRLSPQTVWRLDKDVLRAWQRGRRRKPLRWMGIDEIFWKTGECLTIVSDLEASEPIWAGVGRKRETLDRFFRERLRPSKRAAVEAVCMDMWRPFLESVAQHLPQAAIVFDKFHVMQHVSKAVEETRRAEFFRRGEELRAVVRGKRWLFLTRWQNLGRDKRGQLNQVFALNRRLFKAYFLKESIRRLWSYVYEGAARRFFEEWVASIRWQRLPAFKRLVATLRRHLAGLLAYCHHKVPFGMVEAINSNIRSIIARGRGYADHNYLILKVQRATFQLQQNALSRAA